MPCGHGGLSYRHECGRGVRGRYADPREIEKDAAARYLEERTRLVVDRFGLTGREAEVLGYLCRGFSQVYTARELYISENTVRTHAKHIYAKTGVHSREELLELLNG